MGGGIEWSASCRVRLENGRSPRGRAASAFKLEAPRRRRAGHVPSLSQASLNVLAFRLSYEMSHFCPILAVSGYVCTGVVEAGCCNIYPREPLRP